MNGFDEVKKMKKSADKISAKFLLETPKKKPVVPVTAQIEIARANVDSDDPAAIAEYVTEHAAAVHLGTYYREAVEQLVGMSQEKDSQM